VTKVAEIQGIRWAHRQGMTAREISRKFHVSRKTVRRALQDPGPWRYRRTAARPAPVMDAVAATVARWLEEDQERPRKQRHTARRIYERLVAEYGFAGAESTVRAWVRSHRPTERRVVTLPLAHDPGSEAQMDFGEALAVVGGRQMKVHLFCARLAHSTRDVVVAYSHQDRSCWLDGHVRAFAEWGGVPAEVWYDNPSQLGRIAHGRFVPCDDFSALQSAYGFRAHHCTPAEGHEKGLVEGLVGYVRRTYLVPFPEMATLEELNAFLLEATRREEERRRQGHAETVGERFAREIPLLGALPTRGFRPCTVHSVRATTTQALVTFRSRRYSVPEEHAGQRLSVRAYAEHIEVWDQHRQLARHARHDGPGDPICDFWHYVPSLVQRPGAFRNAHPVRQARFPEEAASLLAALEAHYGDDTRRAHREFLTVCALGRAVEPVRWQAACATALARGEPNAAGVRRALEGAPEHHTLALPARVRDVAVPAGDIAQYDQLLERAAL